MPNDLTLEKQRIADRLASLESAFNTFTAVSELRIKSNEETLDRLNHIIAGNGQPGLSEQIRALNKVEEKRNKHYMAFYCAIIVGFVGAAWKFVGKLFQ